MADSEGFSRTMKSMMGIMMIAIMGTLVVSMMAQAAPEPGQYCDPFDPTTCFSTYEELEAYFQAKYPTVPINIIWQ